MLILTVPETVVAFGLRIDTLGGVVSSTAGALSTVTVTTCEVPSLPAAS